MNTTHAQRVMTLGTVMLVTMASAFTAQAEIVFENTFNFREFRVNPPLDYTQGPDLLILGGEVIDSTDNMVPDGALVTAENSITGEKFFLSPFSSVGFALTIAYTPERASGTWIIGVSSDEGTATTLLPSFGTGAGTSAIPGVEFLTIVPGAQPAFSWSLPPGLSTLNDGNVDRLVARIADSNDVQVLDNNFNSPPTATSYNTPAGNVSHNGAFVGQIKIEGLAPFNRSSTFETFVVDNIGTGGQSTTINPLLFRDNRRPNSVRFGEGDRLALSGNLHPFDGPFYVHAENGDSILTLRQAREADRKFEFSSGFEYDLSLATPWTVVAWNGAVETVAVSQNLGAVALVPFVDNVRMLPNDLTPTVEWNLPQAGTYNSVRLGLFDDVTDERLSRFGLGGDQLFENLAVDATSYKFKSGILETGKKYVVRVVLRNRTPTQILSRSLTFFNFSPIMETSTTPIYLPSLDPGGIYNFDFDVTAGFPVTIDPHLAIGYDYAIGDGNPNFASVTLPFIGDGNYDLMLFDGTGNPLPSIPLEADVTYEFGTSGVDKFRVLGIEESAGLDPTDPTAFMTTVTFTDDGSFTGTMTPIIEPDDVAIADLLGDLEADVASLIYSPKLIKTLGKIDVLIGKGDIISACDQLNKFIKDVGKLIANGQLDADDGDPVPLIDQAEAIKALTSC